jgi:hypothetical protein
MAWTSLPGGMIGRLRDEPLLMGDLRYVPSGLGLLSSQSSIYGPDNVCWLPTTAAGTGLRGLG